MDFYDKLLSHKAINNLTFKEIGNVVDLKDAAVRIAIKRRSLSRLQEKALSDFYNLNGKEQIITKGEKFTADEFRSIRIDMNLTQEKFGEILGLGTRMVQKIEKGDSDISDSVDKLLKMIVKNDSPTSVEQLLKEPEENYGEKISSIEDIIAKKILAKLKPHLNQSEQALAKILLDLDQIKDNINKKTTQL